MEQKYKETKANNTTQRKKVEHKDPLMKKIREDAVKLIKEQNGFRSNESIEEFKKRKFKKRVVYSLVLIIIYVFVRIILG